MSGYTYVATLISLKGSLKILSLSLSLSLSLVRFWALKTGEILKIDTLVIIDKITSYNHQNAHSFMKLFVSRSQIAFRFAKRKQSADSKTHEDEYNEISVRL
jgi:hypothetical protein